MTDVVLKDGQIVFLETSDGLIEIFISEAWQGAAKLEINTPSTVRIATDEQLGCSHATVH
jgi:hypothetical protein